MGQQYAPVAKKANGIKKSVTSRLRGCSFPLLLCLGERIQQRAISMIRRLELLSYKERLRDPRLCSLEKK